jgi:glycerol-3-phosphate dehydrogenase (NAD(P)+)
LTLKNYFLPINVAVAYADYIIFAIPSAFLSDELAKLTVSLQDKIIFSAKGNS